MSKNKNIAFVGMTHLGLNYLAASALKKNYVTGFDVDKKLIYDLKINQINHTEPSLTKILKKKKKLINFSSDMKKLNKFNLVFVSQDVQTDINNKADIKKLSILVNKTLKHINKKATLVILSQLQPGFMRKIRFNKKKLYYQVETLIFGQAIKRALNPERLIIGCNNQNDPISKDYLRYIKDFNCPIIKMKYESAELTKIAINIFLATSVTATNVLAEICSKFNANWNEISPALNLDRRIGKFAYLKPGLGISGGNIERDISVIKNLTNKNLIPNKFVKSILENSNYMKSWVERIMKENKLLKNNIKHKIGILGLSYKENTSSIKNSPTIFLLKKFKNHVIKIYDPKAKLVKKNLKCTQEKNIDSVIYGSDIIIIMTAWKNFKNLEKKINKINKKIVIIDPHKMLDYSLIKSKSLKYYKIG